jgi:hypothetical protein
MKSTINFDDIVADPINRQKRKAREDEFAGAWAAARATTPWKLG